MRNGLSLTRLWTGWIWCFAAVLCADDTPTLRFLLRDGSEIAGTLVTPAAADRFSINSPVFSNPVELPLESLIEARPLDPHHPIDASAAPDGGSATFAFLLRDQSQHLGRLLSWDGGQIEIDSQQSGALRFSEQDLVAIIDRSMMGRKILSLVNSLHRYGDVDGWERDAGRLRCDVPGTSIAAHLELPDRFRLRLAVRCEGRADFAISLGDRTPGGAGQGGRVDRRGGSLSRLPTERFVTRLEWFEQSVAVVRSNPSLSDSAVFDNTSNGPQLQIELYVDQIAGRMIVRDRGQIVADVMLPDDEPVLRRSLTLINDGDPCVVDQIDLFHWDGQTPPSRRLPERFTWLNEGRLLGAVPSGVRDGQLVIGDDRVDVSDLSEARFATPLVYGKGSELVLSDGSRVRGSLNGADEGGAIQVVDTFGNRLSVRPGDVRRMVGPSAAEGLRGLKANADELVVDGLSLNGSLVPGDGKGTRLQWRSALAIESLPIVADHGVEIRFGTPRTTPQAMGVIEFRNGDQVPCADVSFEGGRIRANSPWCGDVRISDAVVSRIVLTPRGDQGLPDRPSLADQTSLLRLPRKMQDSPPTHLLVSPNGDVMRTQLVSIDDQQARIILRDATRLIPRDRIAQIVWIDTQGEQDQGVRPQSPDGQLSVEADRRGRLSLDSVRLEGSVLGGTHRHLGACRVPLEQLDRIRIGARAEPAETPRWVPMKQPRSEY